MVRFHLRELQGVFLASLCPATELSLKVKINSAKNGVAKVEEERMCVHMVLLLSSRWLFRQLVQIVGRAMSSAAMYTLLLRYFVTPGNFYKYVW